MDLDNLAGSYTESGAWRDSTGGSGQLTGNALEVRYIDRCLELHYDDGGVQVTDAIDSQTLPIRMKGTYGPGTLLIGDSSMVVEYEANIDGRAEQNTDVWIILDYSIQRVGVIRQPDRVIWFEAALERADKNRA